MLRSGSAGARSAALALAAACTAACGAQLGDAAVDAEVPCTGGDAAMRSPTGACLFLFSVQVTYVNARASCMSQGGRLAILRTVEDDQAARALAGTRDVFFGLSDQVTEGTFVWADDSAPTYTNWYMNEPNDGGGNYPEDCGVINGARGGAWDDRPCEPIPNVGGGLYAYLCES